VAEADWYYAHNGQQGGPVTLGQLQQMVRNGQLGPSDNCWRDGMAGWEPLSRTHPRLFAAPPAMPPMPPQQAMPMGYYHPPPSESSLGDNEGMRMILPVGRSGWAIAAGYLGLFSVLGCAGPFALIVSIIAIMDIKKHPDRRGMGRAIFGLVMGALGTIMLLLFIIGMVVAPSSRRY
jgi:hypothetical protein